ncbi:alpha/beta fold hydrolase [Bradyrhizobium sp. WYCCWR 13022]|uniref:RBBP9/YdeN family alpha/beta hydrolase n=1 Tax=unclassified Bradyrhizobium TaxID=2631580 RepID=UPI00263A9EEA|nr:alpha/beta hydrolase [Bradyrhizobium sp. WYCCWR 13022]MDN4982738.1 alpha/beta fold hydrolase [Bradyrhizobium sp. WYCCWR 13022]
MTQFIHLPGIGNSGEAHWQSHWELADPTIRRFSPASWDRPDLADWIAALDRAVGAATTPPVLVAHSLACLLVAHWQKQATAPVQGALLVAVPDPQSPAFPVEAAAFTSVPEEHFRFPSMIVASTNDPYASLPYVQARAGQWGSELVNIGAKGHINGASNLGDWPDGRQILTALCARI